MSRKRPVLAAHPSVVAELVDAPQQPRVVDLADVGLVPPGHAGDLNVADMRQPALELRRDVALDDLRVIEIHLHLEIRGAHFVANRMRVRLGREEIIRSTSRGLSASTRSVTSRSLRLRACRAQVAHQRRSPESPCCSAIGAGRARRPTARGCADSQAHAHSEAPSRMLAANSRSRPGSDAIPRSPAPRSPGGALISTQSSACSVEPGGDFRLRECRTRSANSTARNPARAASPKRSRNGTSVNRKLRLAESCGMRRGLRESALESSLRGSAAQGPSR